MTYPEHIEAEAKRLGVTPEDLRAFHRGLRPLPSPQEEVFSCSECGKEYKTESGRDDHVSSKHESGVGDEDGT